MTAIRRIFDYHHDRGDIKSNPVLRTFSVRRMPAKRANILSREDVRSLLNSIDGTTNRGARDLAVLLTVLYTCSRAEAVFSLKRSDYDVNGFITIGGRKLPTHPELKRAIDRYLKPLDIPQSSFLFQSFVGKSSG
jgi:integrase